jgi:hypothetical protein
MIDVIDLATWVAGSVIAVGLIQWAKGLAPAAPSWVWAAVLPLGSLAAALAAGGPRPIWTALGIWAVAQVGWDAILRGIVKRIEGASKPGAAP